MCVCSLGKPFDKDAEKAKEELEANKQSKVLTGLFGLVSVALCVRARASIFLRKRASALGQAP